MELVFCIATRPVAASLMYKIVLIQYEYKIGGRFFLEDNANPTVEIFSSETGNWASWEVGGIPGDFSYIGTVEANFSHRGVLHWLGRRTRTTITYDPYDSPERFGRIGLPERTNSSSGYGSLIYSGDLEMVKYYEMEKGGSAVVRMMVWRLVESEWCVEGEFSFPSLPCLCKRLLVAPNPCNRDVVCHPYVIDNSVLIINLRTGDWKFVNVVDAAAPKSVLCFVGNFYKCWPGCC